MRKLKEAISSEEIISKYRVRKEDWTRERTLTFDRVTILILQGHKFPLQNNLNRFYKDIGEVEEVPTASSYSQARQKLKPELFLYLNSVVRDGFYKEYAEEKKLWRGHRVLGVDGSYLNLPDNEETRERYSVQVNQHKSGDRVQALGSGLYDLLNDIGLDMSFGPKQAEKNFFFQSHIAHTQVGDLILFDRNYADYSVMAFTLKHQRDFLIRFSLDEFSAVKEFYESGKREAIVELRMPQSQKKFVHKHQLAELIQVRLIRVELDNGETEILSTSLLDTQNYPVQEFKQVYSWRWGIETYYDRIKNIFELERFSGKSILTIEQDVYGTLFLATLESVLSKSDEEDLALISLTNQSQYKKQVNHSVSYSAMLDYVVDLLMNKGKSIEHTLEQLHLLFKTNPTLRRDGRNFPRPKRSHSRKLKHHQYSKRIIS